MGRHRGAVTARPDASRPASPHPREPAVSTLDEAFQTRRDRHSLVNTSRKAFDCSLQCYENAVSEVHLVRPTGVSVFRNFLQLVKFFF